MQDTPGIAPRKLKITFALPPPGLAGGIRVAAVYAKLLARRGHHVCFVFRGEAKPLKRERLLRLLGLLPPPPPFEVSPFIKEAGLPYRQVDYEGALDERHFPDADVVIATFWPTAYWVQGLSQAKGAKVYFIQHHEATFGFRPDDARKTYSMPLHKITISQWLKDVMAQEYGHPNVPVIHNSVDMALFNAPPRQRNKDTFNVGFMYATTPFKGVAIALEAWKLLKAAIPEARLICFGAEQPSDSLSLPEETAYYHRPEQDEIREVYAQCDAWLCPSHSEGFALPPLEAMACRCPVVSTRVGAMPELISNGVNGFLADPGDFVQLAEHLKTIAKLDHEEWRAMSDAAYETAASYSWTDATELFEAELFKIVDGR